MSTNNICYDINTVPNMLDILLAYFVLFES